MMFINKSVLVTSLLVSSPFVYYYYIYHLDNKIKKLELNADLLKVKYKELNDNYINLLKMINTNENTENEIEKNLDLNNIKESDIEKTLMF
jgi:hypothetical protein